ncbi:MAG: hypothetical protein IPJ27_20960 [Candidatus Accumulibacter sp.]|uniref:Uncharacterized protein n=1 Tax=Candidatus Accumulibacter proximus TaxID=2954385 RepID=A0A935UHS2_9PROT|nr:hypothetical protein [Candidatus Accumulibacter proximus]
MTTEHWLPGPFPWEILIPGRKTNSYGIVTVSFSMYKWQSASTVHIPSCRQETGCKLSAAKMKTPLNAMFCGVFRVNLLTSTGSGAIAVQYFLLQEWVDPVTGLVALGGLIFRCG